MLRVGVLAVALTVGSAPANGQSGLAERVAQVHDGTARVEFDARAGACGDGRDLVAFRHAMFARSFESWGTWHDVRCVPGPLRVTLTVAGGSVTQLHTQIGGAWPSADGRVSDLGKISSREAAAYFFTLVPALEQQSPKARLLLPAVLADGGQVVTPLLALARDARRATGTRRQAIQWLGVLGDAATVPALASLAKESAGSSDKKGLVSSVASALSYIESDAGVPALIELSRDAEPTTRRATVFWLGQTSDVRATRRLHQVIEDEAEETRTRGDGIFALSHGEAVSSVQFQYLRDLYGRLNDQLRESVIQAMQEDDANGAQWLRGRTRDTNEAMKLRKSALFWLGQRASTSTSDLVSVYRDVTDASLSEHAIFVLSQRDDAAALDALLRIAKDDSDKRMLGKALFWLAQKHDPRVTKLISDILTG